MKLVGSITSDACHDENAFGASGAVPTPMPVLSSSIFGELDFDSTLGAREGGFAARFCCGSRKGSCLMVARRRVKGSGATRAGAGVGSFPRRQILHCDCLPNNPCPLM
jgi:hypothetical protein